MSTDQLLLLAEDYRDMRRDALPILFEELENRGEKEYVEQIKAEMEKGTDSSKSDQGMFGTLLDANPLNLNQIKIQQEKSDLLDEHDVFLEDVGNTSNPNLNTNLSENEIVSQAVRQILKNKKKLSSRIQTIEFMENQWYVNDYIINTVFAKLKRKMNMSYVVVAIVVVFTIIGIMLFLKSNGEFGFAPGLLIIILAIMNINNASRLNKIINN